MKMLVDSKGYCNCSVRTTEKIIVASYPSPNAILGFWAKGLCPLGRNQNPHATPIRRLAANNRAEKICHKKFSWNIWIQGSSRVPMLPDDLCWSFVVGATSDESHCILSGLIALIACITASKANSVYHLNFLRVCSPFRTASDKAALVIAGMIPVILFAWEMYPLYWKKRMG